MATKSRGAGLHVISVLVICWTYATFCLGFERDTRSQFYSHTVIEPTIYKETRDKRDVSSSKNHNEEKLTVGFVAFDNKQFLLKLRMNKDLFPDHYFEKHHQNGKDVTNMPMKQNRSHCHYQGHLQGIKHSWAAISTCSGLSGIIYDGTDLHYLEPDHLSNNSSHFLFKASDFIPNNLSCGVLDEHSFHKGSKVFAELNRHKRSTVLQEPYKSNRKSRYVELIIVNDKQEFKAFNEDKQKVFERSKAIANIVNALYAPLNIFIALVGVIVWSEHDEIKISPDGDATLTNFLHFRRERLAQEFPNDNAQLITATTFENGVVGKALKNTMCTFEFSGGVNMDHSDAVGLVATTISHELGHGFGMEHDTDECKCPDDKCIMSPSSSSTSPRHWSSCSLDYLDNAYTKGMDYCLKNRPSHIIGPVCGNAFVEDGEECDCGLKEFCDNHCCNATSCQLFENATCATGACCDIETCQMKKIATLCRKTIDECDLPELCDGKNEFCPADTFRQNGAECGNGKAYCFDGQCKSHADQCKLLWGESGKMSDMRCYEQNYKGNVNGNCGYNRINQTYKACRKDDMLCGMLHCTHLSEQLNFGMESAAILARSFINVRGRIFTCRSAIVDLGLFNIDPGLAPNGAKCGNEKACVNQKCTPISTIKKVDCPYECSNNGVCNNNGNCHCDIGYAPPFCNTPGPGGSIDSGPASDPTNYMLDVIVVYVVFLGLLPLIILTAGVIYYYRSHVKNWWSKKAHKATIKSRTKTTTQRRALPPSKFNFDRNSLRTLEISAPIPVPSAPQMHVEPNSIQSAHSTPADKGSVERSSFRQMPMSQPTSEDLINDKMHNNKLIPVRPAPPRPDNALQRTPSLSSGTSARPPAVVRSSSLRTSPEEDCTISGRALSCAALRPNCPPPRPPLPKNHSSGFQPNLLHYTYDEVASYGNETDQSVMHNSIYYDDCQALDFSDTPLAFVHSSKQNCLTNKDKVNQISICDDKRKKGPESLVHNYRKTVDKTNEFNSMGNQEKSISKTMFPRFERTGHQVSLVASLAQKFENQNDAKNEDSSTVFLMRPPFKSRPLPPRPCNSEV